MGLLILIGEDDEIDQRLLKRIMETARPNYKIDDRREKALNLGPSDTILKPFIAPEFLEKLDSVLGKSV